MKSGVYLHLVLNCIKVLLTLALFSCTSIDYQSSILSEFLSQYPEPIAFSPNGKNILFKTRNESNFKLLVGGMNFGELKTIDSSSFTQLSLTWSPNSESIYFQEKNESDYLFYLYNVSLNGIRKRISLPPSSTAIPPLRFSQDGTKLAYISTVNNLSTLVIWDVIISKILFELPGVTPYHDFDWNDSILHISDPNGRILLLSSIYSIDTIFDNPDFEIKKIRSKYDKSVFIGRANTDSFYTIYHLDHYHPIPVKTSNVHYDAIALNKYGDSIFPTYSVNGFKTFRLIEQNMGYQPMNITQDGKTYFMVTSPIQSKSVYCSIPGGNNIDTIYPSRVSADMSFHFYTIDYGDGTSFPLHIWKDEEIPSDAVIYVHGGPNLFVEPGFKSWIYWLVKNNYAVLIPNYHGSTGFGRHLEGGSFQDQVSDIIRTIKFCEDSLQVDKEKITLVGSSYGAKLTFAATHYIDKLGGILSLSGSIDGSTTFNDQCINKKSIIGFYGEMDAYTTTRASEFFRKNGILNDKQFKIFPKEGHYFHRTGSWAEVYSNIQ